MLTKEQMIALADVISELRYDWQLKKADKLAQTFEGEDRERIERTIAGRREILAMPPGFDEREE